MSAPPPAPVGSAAPPPVSRTRYALAVAATVAAVLSQYVVPSAVPALAGLYGSLASDLAIVYGIPVVAFALLVGVDPLRRWAAAMPDATWEGLRWYGGLSALGIVVLAVLVAIYSALDPAALNNLFRPNPVLQEAAGNPAFWIAFSFVIGAFEETIFRGWIFGYWRGQPGLPWWVHAVWTSALFAGVHLYYGLTYGVAAPLFYPLLFLLGFAFAATYHASGGNLVVVAVLHGANDASSFLTLVSPNAALATHYGLIGVGAVVALLHGLGWRRFRPPPPVPPPIPPPPPPPPPGGASVL